MLEEYMHEVQAGRRLSIISLRSSSTVSSTNSVFSLRSTEGWDRIRRDLEQHGFPTSVTTQRQDFIVRWLEEAMPTETIGEGDLSNLTTSRSQIQQDNLLQSPSLDDSPHNNRPRSPSRIARLSFKLFGSTNDIFSAISSQDWNKLEKFVNLGVKVDAIDKEGNYPILNAALQSSDSHVVQFLCEKGRFIHREQALCHVFDKACSLKRWDIVESILKGGFKPTALAMKPIWKSGNTSTVALLISMGYHIVEREEKKGIFSFLFDRSVEAPLHVASIHGCTATVELLLENSADIEEKVEFFHEGAECTSLHFATFFNHPETMEMLLTHNAAVETLDYYGNTPLIRASKKGHEVAVGVLLRFGANVEAANEECMTSLFQAVSKGHADITQLLLNHGADTKSIDHRGWTALHYAASIGNKDIARMLLASSADIKALNCKRRSALQIACISRRSDSAMVKLLIEEGSNIDSKDKNGWTALHHAIARKSVPVILLLLASAATISHIATVKPRKKEREGTVSGETRVSVNGFVPQVRANAIELAKLGGSSEIFQLVSEYSFDQAV
jgi:ankyrin repeat protein